MTDPEQSFNLTTCCDILFVFSFLTSKRPAETVFEATVRKTLSWRSFLSIGKCWLRPQYAPGNDKRSCPNNRERIANRINNEPNSNNDCWVSASSARRERESSSRTEPFALTCLLKILVFMFSRLQPYFIIHKKAGCFNSVVLF